MDDKTEQLYQELIAAYPRIGVIDGEYAARWAVQRIAEAVAAEREACAKEAMAHYASWSKSSIDQSDPEEARVASLIASACRTIAWAIRARSECKGRPE